MRRVLTAIWVVMFLISVSACTQTNNEQISIPGGEALVSWPSNAAFSDIPVFTAGTFNTEKSEIKDSTTIVVFNDVALTDYEAYVQSLTDSGLSITMQSDSDTIKNIRYSSEDGSVMVRMLFLVPDQELTITLVDTTIEDNT
jgi:hypothetical protein